MIATSHNSGAKGGAIHLKSVLIVEDDPNDFELANRELKKLGLCNPIHHVSSVEEMIAYMRGDDAFASREKYPLPTLVFLDMHLATSDGLDAAAWLRSQRKFRKIPIIAISGSGTERLQAAVEMGAHALMVKPFKSSEFKKIIAKLDVELEFDPPTD
jgi:CheY-like chemotaxis protein